MDASQGAAPDPSKHGFQFPGDFELTALGVASADLPAKVPAILAGLGLAVLHETVRSRPSREGRFVSVTVSFHCQTRAQYEAAHAALRADPDIHYTL